MGFLDNKGLETLWEKITAKLNDKVNVEAGKGLSTNDYTTKEKEKLASLATPDWNAAEGEEGYIENRTHWKEFSRGLLLETEVTVSEDAPEFPIPNKIGLSVGETYTVSWAGTEYTCIAEAADISGILAPALGNLTIMGGSTGEDLPFVLVELPDIAEGALGEGIWGAFFPLDTLIGTLSVFGSTVIYHKLEKNFLPAEADITTLNIRNGSAIGSIRTSYSDVESVNYQIGKYAFSEGYVTRAEGHFSHAEGGNAQAKGDASHAEGGSTYAEGHSSHAEGNETHAEGDCSHAEGDETHAKGNSSHAEGHISHAEGDNSHAEGYNTYAKGISSHAEGDNTDAEGNHSHAEGYQTKAEGNNSHAEGSLTYAKGVDSHAEGWGTRAESEY